MTNEQFAQFEDMVRDYGRACADVATAQEWGSGTASAEREKKTAYKAVIDFVNENTPKEN
jgi:hypothetical protein